MTVMLSVDKRHLCFEGCIWMFWSTAMVQWSVSVVLQLWSHTQQNAPWNISVKIGFIIQLTWTNFQTKLCCTLLICSNATHVHIICDDCLRCTKWYSKCIRNLMYGNLTINTNKMQNFVDIFETCPVKWLSRFAFILQWCLFFSVPYKTLSLVHGIIHINLSKLSKCLCNRFPEFNTKLHILCSNFRSILKLQHTTNTI